MAICLCGLSAALEITAGAFAAAVAAGPCGLALVATSITVGLVGGAFTLYKWATPPPRAAAVPLVSSNLHMGRFPRADSVRRRANGGFVNVALD